MKLMGMEDPPGGKKPRKFSEIVKNPVPYSGLDKDGKPYVYQGGNMYAIGKDDKAAIEAEYPDGPFYSEHVNGKVRAYFDDPETKDRYFADFAHVGGALEQQRADDAKRAKEQKRIESARAARAEQQAEAQPKTPNQQKAEDLTGKTAVKNKKPWDAAAAIERSKDPERVKKEMETRKAIIEIKKRKAEEAD